MFMIFSTNDDQKLKLVKDNDQEPKVIVREPKWLDDLNKIRDINTWLSGLEDGPAVDPDTTPLAVTISNLFIVVKKEYENVLIDFIDRCHSDYKDPDYSMFNSYAQFNHEALEVFRNSKLKMLNVKVTSEMVDTEFEDGSLGIGITVKTICKHDIEDMFEFIEANEVAVDILSMILRNETKSDNCYMVMQMNATLNERLESNKNTELGVEVKYMNHWIRMVRVKDEVEFGDTCYGAVCRTNGRTINYLNGQIVHVKVYEVDENNKTYIYGEYDVITRFYLPTNTALDPDREYRISCRISDLEDNSVVRMWYAYMV